MIVNKFFEPQSWLVTGCADDGRREHSRSKIAAIPSRSSVNPSASAARFNRLSSLKKCGVLSGSFRALRKIFWMSLCKLKGVNYINRYLNRFLQLLSQLKLAVWYNLNTRVHNGISRTRTNIVSYNKTSIFFEFTVSVLTRQTNLSDRFLNLYRIELNFAHF